MVCDGDGLLCSVGECPECEVTSPNASNLLDSLLSQGSEVELLLSPQVVPSDVPATPLTLDPVRIPDAPMVLEMVDRPDLQTLLTNLSPADLEAWAALDYADTLRGSLHEYVKAAWSQLELGVTLDDDLTIKAICDHVQWQLEDRMIATGYLAKPPGWKKQRAKNLLIRVPPRHLKTTIVSILAPTWAWTRWPHLSIFALSANPRVAHDSAIASRKIIGSDWYQLTFRPNWVILPNVDSAAFFANSVGGSRKSRGVSSRVTGEGANWMIVDDPHDAEEVHSDAKRNAVHRKWETGLANRLNDVRYDIRTGIAQALHHDDWGERRIKEGWELLRIRMVFEERDRSAVTVFGWTDWRLVDGEPTSPERYPPEELKQLKIDKGPFVWATQYQQDPTPINGGMVKLSDIRYYDDWKTLSLSQVVCSVDASFKKTTTGSRVSVVVVGRGKDSTGKEIRVMLDNDTRPMHMMDTIDAVKMMHRKWSQISTTLVEDKANGSEIVRQLQLEILGVIAVNPGSNSKEGRLMSVTPVFEGHGFLMPRVADWKDDTLYELTRFPNAPKDDIVDATVQALIYMRGSHAAQRALAGCQL